MSKLIGLACTVAFVSCCLVKPRNDRFLKYKAVETYEVRPGILMMPRYSVDGQICQIVIEKDHYFSGTVDLDSTLPREVITQIVDELVPANERGPLTMNKEMSRLSVYTGNSVTSFVDYKNVSVDVSRPASSPGDIVAVVQWKNRTCQ